MGITSRLDQVRRRLHVVVQGRVTLAEIRQHIVQERDSFQLGYQELIDAREWELGLSADEMRRVGDEIRQLAALYQLGPTAVLVGSDPAFGMVRMLGLQVDDICSVRPFRSLAEAERWLVEGVEA